MKKIIVSCLLLLCAMISPALSAESANPPENTRVANIFDDWLVRAFGVDLERSADGKITAKARPDLPELASAWYRRNGKLGEPLTSVPIETLQNGNFLLLSFDFSAAWPDVEVAKRHVIYYLGKPTIYALIQDEIQSSSIDFWTMQLQVPDELVPVNWDINLQDTDRRADLLAALEGDFNPEIELNKPVSGYAKSKSGTQMLLARLLKVNEMAEKEADKMSPMNIRIQDGQKWLTTEVRSSAPAIQFALIPYIQNRDEVPMAILSENALRLEWFAQSHRFTYFPKDDGNLEFMLAERSKDELNQYGFGMDFIEVKRPEGRLVASYDFESLDGGLLMDQTGSFNATVERGKLVDGLQGKSIYLGYPDRPERSRVAAGITIPSAIRQELTNGHLSISFWYKSPMGQGRQRPDNFAWPMGDAMRDRQYLDTGLFRVGHTHWQLNPNTRGFNAAWQERAESGSLVPGKWNHLVFSVQELDAEKFLYQYDVYVNGVIRTSRELGPISDLKNARRIDGFDSPILIGNVWGTLDNLAIYNYPLGEDEILDLYEEQLQKKVSYYSCNELIDGSRVESVPVGDSPEDQILNNHWVPERSFAGTAKDAELVPGVKGKALALKKDGLQIPEKAMWDLSQGAFTYAFYFKYSGRGSSILNTSGIRLDINHNKFHGAIGNDWEDKYLGDKERIIEPDIWHHIVLAYDRREMVMYLNGEELYRRPMASKEGINFSDTIKIGGNCIIDEVHMYNYAINESEVKELSAHLPQQRGLIH